jgi:hypothetical protein
MFEEVIFDKSDDDCSHENENENECDVIFDCKDIIRTDSDWYPCMQHCFKTGDECVSCSCPPFSNEDKRMHGFLCCIFFIEFFLCPSKLPN